MEVESDDDLPDEKIEHLSDFLDDDEGAGNDLSFYVNV